MPELTPFSFENHNIRVVTDDNGEPLFVAKDVAEALGYNTSNISDRINHVPAEWRGSVPIATLGGTQQLLALTEQGLYFFLGRSDKPKALPFQKWLAGDVVPTIRKTGSYALPNAQPSIESLKLVPAAMAAAKAFGFSDTQAALSADKAVKAITGVSALALMGHTALIPSMQDQLLTPSDMAERLGWKIREVNPRLILAGLQDEHRDHKDRLYYELTELGRGFGVYLDTGKSHSNGTPIRQIKWRASTIDFLRTQTAQPA